MPDLKKAALAQSLALAAGRLAPSPRLQGSVEFAQPLSKGVPAGPLPEAPLFSVIVPVYNVESYLVQCVGSVLAETPSFEVILVDDGSTDKSGLVCDAFAQIDPRVVALHQENRGLAGARATGLQHARGTWVLYLDSDDLWPAGALSALEQALAEHPGFSVYECRYLELDEAKGTLAPNAAIHFTPGPCQGLPFSQRVARFAENGFWSVWKLCLRRSFLEETGVAFDEAAVYAEDLPYVLDLLLAADSFCALDVTLVHYRINRAGSLLNTNLPKHFRGLAAVYRHFAPRLASMSEDERETVLARIANALWPDLRALAGRDAATRRQCLADIEALRPVWGKGTENRGSASRSLLRLALGALGPGPALRLAHVLHPAPKEAT